MGHLYFDESIHERAGFIVGACVYSLRDLTPEVHQLWAEQGLDPATFEYKSSTPKARDQAAQTHRSQIHSLLHEARISLVVCPAVDRRSLGSHAIALVRQLVATGSIPAAPYTLYLDDNISLSQHERDAVQSYDVTALVRQDSRAVGGLQVADHAAHSLSGMLLEEMGLLKKMIRAGPGSGYDPDLMIELGFEMWASLRYSLIVGPNNASIDDDQLVMATFPMDGYGLYIAPSCSDELREHAISRFGTNYVGCIH